MTEIPPKTINEQFLLEIINSIRLLRGDIGTMKSDIDTMKSDIDTMKSDIGTMKSDIDTMKSDIDTMKSDVGTMKGDIGTTKGDIGTMKVDLEELKEKVYENSKKAGLTQKQLQKILGGGKFIVKDKEGRSFHAFSVILDQNNPPNSILPQKSEYIVTVLHGLKHKNGRIMNPYDFKFYDTRNPFEEVIMKFKRIFFCGESDILLPEIVRKRDTDCVFIEIEPELPSGVNIHSSPIWDEEKTSPKKMSCDTITSMENGKYVLSTSPSTLMGRHIYMMREFSSKRVVKSSEEENEGEHGEADKFDVVIRHLQLSGPVVTKNKDGNFYQVKVDYETYGFSGLPAIIVDGRVVGMVTNISRIDADKGASKNLFPELSFDLKTKRVNPLGCGITFLRDATRKFDSVMDAKDFCGEAIFELVREKSGGNPFGLLNYEELIKSNEVCLEKHWRENNQKVVEQKIFNKDLVKSVAVEVWNENAIAYFNDINNNPHLRQLQSEHPRLVPMVPSPSENSQNDQEK